MPRSKQHKAKSRERILVSAYQLFSRSGYEHVSIDDVMAHAGLTRGAFYAHFSNKAELYAESIKNAALIRTQAMLNDQQENYHWVQTAVDNYLSNGHIIEEAIPCPIAFLVSDIAIREPLIRTTYSEIYRALVGTVREKLSFLEEEKRERQAHALIAMLVGAVAVARALNSEIDANQVLESCRESVRDIVASASSAA